MVGLCGSGKTSILNKLRYGETGTTLPSINFNEETIEFQTALFHIYDVCGQDKIRPLWSHYFEKAQGIIFVVDSSEDEYFELAREEIHRVMSDEKLINAALLVFANKQDLSSALDAEELGKKLQLTKLRFHKWKIQNCIATTGEGLNEGLTFLTKEILK
ncbi:adp-ribosylation factor a1e [Anaeramoeba flamelloides]|uniref:Adp-ribosylation factor a1e n=1 Tax=Anaeramoeba flamelloides TaxID=1746091 RepID=A0ABQ8Y449_9EUKA|nr:adp-ribosylation factor a1e [Anaeramoeba flamelloides]